MNECTMIQRGIPYSYRYDYDVNSHQFVFKSISKIYGQWNYVECDQKLFVVCQNNVKEALKPVENILRRKEWWIVKR